MKLIIGILMAIIALFIVAPLTPPVQEIFSTTEGSNSFNCVGYVDQTDGTYNYNASLNTNTFGCAVAGFGIPLVILIMLLGIGMYALYGPSQRDIPYGGGQQAYQQY